MACSSNVSWALKRVLAELITTLRSNDANGNEKVKKQMVYKQNNNFARAWRFFVHFFPVFHDYDVKMPNFAFREDLKKQRGNFISLSELDYGPLKIQLQGGSPTFDKVSG